MPNSVLSRTCWYRAKVRLGPARCRGGGADSVLALVCMGGGGVVGESG